MVAIALLRGKSDTSSFAAAARTAGRYLLAALVGGVGHERRVEGQGDLKVFEGTEATSILANPERNTKTKRSVKAGSSSAGGSRTMHHTGETRVMAWLHGKYAPAIIAFVGALVGVGLSAGLILFFTHGKGTDTVVHEWLMLQESTLAAATNGEVFADPTDRKSVV